MWSTEWDLRKREKKCLATGGGEEKKKKFKQQVSESNPKSFKTNLYYTVQLDGVLTLNAQHHIHSCFQSNL